MAVFEEKISRIEVEHKKGFTPEDKRARLARTVVWAVTETDKRVWLHTVEGGLDVQFVEIKVAMVAEYFKDLAGQTIRFEEARGFLALRGMLPDRFRAPYAKIRSEMSDWVEANCRELLERLRAEKSAKAARTKTKKEEADTRRFANALKLAFVRGRNPKRGNERWEAKRDGRLYILDDEQPYSPSEKEVPVERMKDIVPDRIILVQRID